MNILSRGWRVLTEEGLGAFVRKGAKLVSGVVYWAFNDAYRLSIDETTVSFSAPNYTTVRRNENRFRSERAVLDALCGALDDDDVFYDIGANTGLYTLFAAQHCSTVVAFEPYPPNADLLRTDAARNGLSNVEVFEIALSDTNGVTAFEQPAKADVGYGSASIVGEETGGSVTVPTRTGDDLIAQADAPAPNVVKIDVEGSESLVIEGLKHALSDPACRLVYCEVHTGEVDHRPSIHDFGLELDDIKAQLQDCGFVVEELEQRRDEFFIRGRK